MPAQLPEINTLWDYGDPASTESKFRELLPEAQKREDLAYELELLTQIARTYSLRKRFDEAHEVLDGVEFRMEKRTKVEVRYLLERGRAFNSSGNVNQAMTLFKRALAVGQTINEPFYVVDALHMLGIAAPSKERLSWNLKAIQFAEGASDLPTRRWLGSLYNNTGWTHYDEGRYSQALELFQKCYAHFDSDSQPERANIAKWSMGKTLRAMGKLAEDLEIQRELERNPDHTPFVEEEIAECLHAMGNIDQSKPYFARAHELLSRIDWVAEDVERLERLKKLGGL